MEGELMLEDLDELLNLSSPPSPALQPAPTSAAPAQEHLDALHAQMHQMRAEMAHMQQRLLHSAPLPPQLPPLPAAAVATTTTPTAYAMPPPGLRIAPAAAGPARKRRRGAEVVGSGQEKLRQLLRPQQSSESLSRERKSVRERQRRTAVNTGFNELAQRLGLSAKEERAVLLRAASDSLASLQLHNHHLHARLSGVEAENHELRLRVAKLEQHQGDKLAAPETDPMARMSAPSPTTLLAELRRLDKPAEEEITHSHCA